ncbi:N-acetylmuramoyl-L-alanine amidase [Paenibacillus chitinolyticus]|uniref:N-acetylmuramoyl-L-alanine amidase n=1 Tax=Paenibacillus chitinolyticus TaxID=79263 RepID=UPI00366D8DD0
MKVTLKVVFDGGHGPNTQGKRTPDGSLKEYEFNRAVANYAAPMLREYNGVEVQFTHSDARDVPLKERTDQANRWGADLFVSIHANSAGGSGWSDASGIETFIYTSNPKDSRAIAEVVQQHMVMATGLRDRGVKLGDLHVLRETHMTSILVECGFMSNHAEAELLKQEPYRKTCAGAIVNAIVKHYGLQPIQKLEATKLEKWKLDMAMTAMDELAAKGILSDAEMWKKQLQAGEIEKDLPWLMFTLMNRIAK